MSEHTESVKEVSQYLREIADRYRHLGKDDKSEELAGYAAVLEFAVDHIALLEGLTSALPPDLGNIHDLPQELLDELSVAKTDEVEDQIVTVINSYAGEATLDQILVGLFRKFNVVQKRRFMQNKLYRMTMVWSVEGRKGIYTTTKPSVQDTIDELIGAPSNDGGDIDSDIPF